MASPSKTASSLPLAITTFLFFFSATTVTPTRAAGHTLCSSITGEWSGHITGAPFEAWWHYHSSDSTCFKIPISKKGEKTYAIAISPEDKMPSIGEKGITFFFTNEKKLYGGIGTEGYEGTLLDGDYMKDLTLNNCADQSHFETLNGFAMFTLKNAGCGVDLKAFPSGNIWLFPILASNGNKHDAQKPRGGECNILSPAKCSAKVVGVTRSEKQTHGSMMIIAWILLSTGGIFTGRFMRHVLGKKGVWFKIHLYCQLGAVVLTTISYIYITAIVRKHNDGESKIYDNNENPHRKMGFAVWILSLVQAILGFARNWISGPPTDKNDKHDHGPRRWLFQLLHIVIGYATWIMAFVSIWYGIKLLGGNDDQSEEAVDKSYRTLLIVYLIFMVVVFTVLEIMKWMRDKLDKLGETPSKAMWSHAFALVVACAISATISLILAVNDKTDDSE